MYCAHYEMLGFFARFDLAVHCMSIVIVMFWTILGSAALRDMNLCTLLNDEN